MATPLTWDDLLIQNLKVSDTRVWLSHWAGWVDSAVKPVFMSKFGDWFLRLPDGSTAQLSVIEGMYDAVATTPEEFTALAKSTAWQAEYLRPHLVQQLRDRGLVPQAGQCYGFTPHPALTGGLDAEHAVVMEIGAWQQACAEAFKNRRKKQP